jgi:hypothetical protein
MIEAKKNVIEFHNESDMMRNEKSIEKNAKRRKRRCDKSITQTRNQKNESKIEFFYMID